MKTRALVALVWLSSSSACSTQEPLVLLLEAAGQFDALFALELDRAGNPSFVSPPFRMDGEAREKAQTFRLTNDGEGWLVGYDENGLREATRLYEPSRRDELALQLGRREECPQGAYSRAERRLELSAPPPVRAWKLADEKLIETPAEAVPFWENRSLSMALPIDADACIEPTHRMLRPFAATEVPIPVGTVIEGHALTLDELLYHRVFRLPGDRVLLLTPFWLFLLEPDAPFVARPGNYLPIAPASVALATDLRPGMDASIIRIVLVNDSGSPTVTKVWQELELGPSGLRFVESIELPEFLQDVIFDPDTGWFIAAGELGSIVVRRDRSSALEWKPNRFTTEDGRAMLARTGWPDRPYVLTGGERAQVLLGTPDLESWEILPATRLDAAGRLRSLAVVPSAEGQRIYVGTHNAELYWYDRTEQAWNAHPFRLPADYECGADDGCGARFQVQALRDISYVRRSGVDHLYAAMNDCMAILDIRLDATCAGFLRMPGRADLRPPTVTTAGGPFLLNVRAIHVSESGMLTVASQEGGVYEMAVGDQNEGVD